MRRAALASGVVEASREAPGRAFCPECAQKYAVPVAELQRRPGLRFRATCHSCKTTFTVRWENGRLQTEVEQSLDAANQDGREVLRPGMRLDRKYEIEEAIASGGSSTIYRAFDWGANRHVALKVLHRSPDDQNYGLRFQREVEVQGNLKHPHLMPIFDHGAWEGHPYYTMELLHKPMSLDSLVGLWRANRLRYHPSLRHLASLRGLLRGVVLPVTRAIAFANDNGVIHRDLKPGNVLLDAKTLHVYVIDFGICHLFKRAGSRIVLRAGADKKEEQARMAMGTIRLMPPEQARGGVSEQGDVWALGCLLYFLLNGDAPIAPSIDMGRVSLTKRVDNLQTIAASSRAAGDEDEAAFYEAKLEELRSGSHRTMREMIRDAQEGNYLPIEDRVDPALAAIVHRAMKPDVKERYPTAHDFRLDLERWLDGKPVRAYAVALGSTRGAFYRARLFARRHQTLLIASAAALALAFVSLAVWHYTTTSRRNKRIRELVAQARATADPRVQEDKLRTVLVLEPGHAEGRALLEVSRRFVPLKRRVAEAEELSAEIQKLRRSGRALSMSSQADDLAAILSGSVIPALEALPLDYPGRRLAAQAKQYAGFLRGQRIVRLRNLPLYAHVYCVPARARGSLELDWDAPIDWGKTPLAVPDFSLGSGTYVVWIQHRSGRAVFCPFQIDLNSDPLFAVDVPVDPEQVPEGMCFVPGGEEISFGDLRFFEEERVSALDDFFIDQHEVTNEEYAEFLATLDAPMQRTRVPQRVIDARSQRTAVLWDQAKDGSWRFAAGSARHPVTGISLDAARHYARWAGKRLPTKDEWERAARGKYRRDFPFGNSLDRAACNCQTGTVGRVGSHPRDRSPYGVFDLGGNVAEWTVGTTGSMAVIKGGSFDLPRYRAMVAAEGRRPADLPHADVGFRCAKSKD